MPKKINTLDMTPEMSPEDRRVVRDNREKNRKEQNKKRAQERKKKDIKRENTSA